MEKRSKEENYVESFLTAFVRRNIDRSVKSIAAPVTHMDLVLSAKLDNSSASIVCHIQWRAYVTWRTRAVPGL